MVAGASSFVGVVVLAAPLVGAVAEAGSVGVGAVVSPSAGAGPGSTGAGLVGGTTLGGRMAPIQAVSDIPNAATATA